MSIPFRGWSVTGHSHMPPHPFLHENGLEDFSLESLSSSSLKSCITEHQRAQAPATMNRQIPRRGDSKRVAVFSQPCINASPHLSYVAPPAHQRDSIHSHCFALHNPGGIGHLVSPLLSRQLCKCIVLQVCQRGSTRGDPIPSAQDSLGYRKAHVIMA